MKRLFIIGVVILVGVAPIFGGCAPAATTTPPTTVPTTTTPTPTSGLFGVWGSSASDVFAVGGVGTILHYDGKSW
ncbi:MAG: hypothetical protein MUO99_06480, partial [Dehalococcoidales bacterium]|nr:hypothetical protein [Dehalococcoidales bacterium]